MNGPVRALATLLGLALVLGVFAPAVADEGSERGHSGEKGPRFGSFEERASREVRGDIVSFTWTPTAVRNFTVNGTKLFDLEAPPASGSGNAKIVGSVIKVDGASYELVAHDNPMGVLKVDADGEVLIRLAPGAVASRAGEHVLVRFGAVSGRLFHADDVQLGDGTITTEDGFHFILESPVARFDADRPELAKATADKKIGAEISLGKAKRHDVVSFGNVTADVLRTPGDGGRDVLVRIDGHGFEGRVVVLNVDADVFAGARANDLRVHFDNESVRAADGLADILDPDDDGLEPEYWLGYDVATEGFQLVVSVPHYSVHEIRVASLLAEAPPQVVVGVVLAIAAVAGCAVLLFRPRRDEP